MGDWQIAGNVGIFSPGYNSNYCVRLLNYAVFKNIAYMSDAFMLIGYMKYSILRGGYIKIGHTGYGDVTLINYYNPANPSPVAKDWFKFRYVTYYNNNLGYAIGVIEEWDEENNQWKSLASVTFSNKTEPIAGNVYFQTNNAGSTEYGATSITVFLDNIELYTGKSLYISKIVSEAIEKVVSTS